MSTPTPVPDDDHLPLLAAYALGEADPETVQRVEELLKARPDYQAVLESYRALAEVLPLAATPAEPSAELRERIIARVAAEAGGAAAPKARPRRLQRPWLNWRRLALGLNLALILGLAGWNIALQQQQQAEAARFQRSWNTMVAAMTAPGVQQFQLSSSDARVSAAFLFAPEQRAGCLVASGLPPLPADQTYQVWIEQNGQLASVGTFRTNAAGNGWLVVNNATPLSDFSSVKVTVEPLGGSAAPNSQPIISGNLG